MNTKDENAPKLQGRGGAGRGQGQKKKNNEGKIIWYNPKQDALDILKLQPRMSVNNYIDAAEIAWNNRIQETIIEADNDLNKF